MHGVEGHGFGNGDAEALQIFLESCNATFPLVAGDEPALVAHQLCEIRGLATGSGAGIEDGFAGLWIEQLAGGEGARVLHVAEALLQPRGGEMTHAQHARMRGERFSICGGAEEFARRDFELVHARVDFGGGIVPSAKSGGGFAAEVGGPAIEEEVWVGGTDGEIGVGEKVFESCLFAQGPAQNGVDQTTSFAAEFHRLMHGGVDSYTEMEELVEAEAKDVAGAGVEFGERLCPGTFWLQSRLGGGAQVVCEIVEGAEIAEDAEEGLADEGSLARARLLALEEGVEDFVREGLAFFPLEQRLESGLAGFGRHGEEEEFAHEKHERERKEGSFLGGDMSNGVAASEGATELRHSGVPKALRQRWK